MTDKTGIEWTDATWNPTTGCDRVSPGCGLPRFDGDDVGGCYAMALAARLKAMGSAKYQTDGDPRTSGPGFGVAMHEDALSIPLRWQRPRRIFVNSMSDLFHDGVPDEFITRVFAVMARAPQHTFQLLTKRHGRMRSLLADGDFAAAVKLAAVYLGPTRSGIELNVEEVPWPLPNVWIGVSVESQQWADIRIPALLDTPAAVRWISAEPLLGPVNLNSVPDGTRLDGGPRRSSALTQACPTCGGWGTDCGRTDYHFTRRRGGLDWVVAGGESGPNARPMHPDWARQLRAQCQAASVPYLFKQAGEVLAREWGCKSKKGGDASEWPEAFPREYPG